jgi:hypothetical protein
MMPRYILVASAQIAWAAAVTLGKAKCADHHQDNQAYFEHFKEEFPVPEGFNALKYNGISAPERCYEGEQDEHFFILGDYGGITCNDLSGTSSHKDPWAYTCGRNDHGDNRGRKDVYVKCADNTKDHPERGRHFTQSDARPQFFVADQMRKYAPRSKPRFFLNGGDNFYFGGLDIICGQHPMNTTHERTRVQFDGVFEKMYSGAYMEVPWFSTMGNHDFGGRKFNAAWDQQIAYTWSTANTSTQRWYLPGMYWHQRVNYPTKNFTVDIFMLDTNKGDAKHFSADAGHNICGTFNDRRNNCEKAGGPSSMYSCQGWFQNLWNTQSAWLEKHLEKADSDWQILVTHFPPENFRGWIKPLHKKYGIDLYVGSHRHSQELHMNTNWLEGLNYVIAGGGGGITSEFNPGWDNRGQRQYGFMDVTINKTHMKVDSINEHGKIVDTAYIEPRPPQGEPTCKHYGCNAEYKYWRACQCTADCWKHKNDWHKESRCCEDFQETCPALASCKALGCNKFDWKKPCQCTQNCERNNDCCADFSELCNPLELQTDQANCAKDCSTVDDKNRTIQSSCQKRVGYAMSWRGGRQKLEDAIGNVNEECADQCNCSVKYWDWWAPTQKVKRSNSSSNNSQRSKSRLK